MAFDEELAGRIRAALSFTDGVTEQRMFGGLGFMVDGHLAAAASSRGGLMLRIDPSLASGLVDGDAVRPFRMHGRDLAGWVLVAPEAVDDDSELLVWLGRAQAWVATLPPK
ncbi:MAG: TfoX/Sxy family protein [Propionicimonas sp.]|uniref:TfoX/Sxy family protein n=1 Tax=Propionicimonas sp. TaxID=1955623 RepID=UPI003D12A6F4